ncbi:MAG: hypothetical protein LC664_13795, partial [Flavobacteriales bacterium]|nr:hypothetical protein [Flavobacteriales bacterium]
RKKMAPTLELRRRADGALSPETSSGLLRLPRNKFGFREILLAQRFGDSVGMTPLLPMYTLGSDFIPAEIHAGGLRYHGAGVLVSQLLKDGLISAVSKDQLECFEAGLIFARAEGVIPAPEATYAIAKVIEEAREAKEAGDSRTILFNLCGHGHFDLSAYEKYMNNELVNHAYVKA